MIDRLGLIAPDRIKSALQWLIELRLVTRSNRRDKEDLLVMHEVIRAFVHNSVSLNDAVPGTPRSQESGKTTSIVTGRPSTSSAGSTYSRHG